MSFHADGIPRAMDYRRSDGAWVHAEVVLGTQHTVKTVRKYTDAEKAALTAGTTRVPGTTPEHSRVVALGDRLARQFEYRREVFRTIDAHHPWGVAPVGYVSRRSPFRRYPKG